MKSDNKDNGSNDGIVEGRIVFDDATQTFSVEIPSEDSIPSDQLRIRQQVSQAFAGLLRDGSRAAMRVLQETPRDPNWVELLVATLEPFGYRVNDEVLRLIQAEAVGKDRDVEVQLRYLLGRIFSARREASLGLDEIERGLALVRSDQAADALALYHLKANLLCIAGDANCPDACRHAIRAARALAKHHAAANVFRIWSMFHWKRGEPDKAIPLFDAATEHLRNVGGAAHAFHLLDTLERISGLDRERMRRYIDEIIGVITDGRALDETRTARAGLLVAQCLMAAAPTQEERELALEQTVRALMVFRRFVGFEGRAAACSTLLSIEYARRGDFGLAETYTKDHELWLAAIYDGDEALRSELSVCLLEGDVDRVFEYEARVSMHPNTGVYAMWATVAAIILMRNKEHDRALALLWDAERQLVVKPSDRNHSDLALIYRTRAEAFRALGDQSQHLNALAEVVRLLPADLDASWLLCAAALRNGANEIAAGEAAKLIAARPMAIGPYRIAARAHARRGAYQIAAEILDQAFARFPDNMTIAAERREAHDLRLGISQMAPADIAYVPEMPNYAEAPLPEVAQLPKFHREVAAAP